MAEFRCACGRLMSECPFWRQVRDRMRAAGHADFELGNFGLRFDHGTGVLGRIRTGSLRWSSLEAWRDAMLGLVPGQRQSFARLAQRNLDFANAVLDLEGGEVFVDTSKERMRVRYLHRYLDMEVRAIHLVRDVRAVAASALRRHPEVRPEDVGRSWASTNATIMRQIAMLPAERRTLVRYEDAVRDPDTTLSRLYSFCGLDPQARQASGPPELHLLGNAARLRPLEGLTLDERWRSALDPTAIDAITSAAWQTMKQLYPEVTLATS
jgi:hypothetical protein